MVWQEITIESKSDDAWKLDVHSDAGFLADH